MTDELTILKVDSSTWSSEAQAGELEFHKRPNFRSNEEGFNKANHSFFTGLGYKPTDMVGKKVVDLGAGSKLRAKFFQESTIIAIEPLGDRFMQDVEWCDLKDAERVYSLPAEHRIKELEGQVDFLFSVNVLDHCYDFEIIVKNILSYLKTGGRCCLSFDCHSKVDKLHPIIINEKVATQIFFDAGFRIDKFLRTTSYHKAIAEYSVTFFMTKV